MNLLPTYCDWHLMYINAFLRWLSVHLVLWPEPRRYLATRQLMWWRRGCRGWRRPSTSRRPIASCRSGRTRVRWRSTREQCRVWAVFVWMWRLRLWSTIRSWICSIRCGSKRRMGGNWRMLIERGTTTSKEEFLSTNAVVIVKHRNTLFRL